MMAQTGSVYLTVCVTLERFVAVCRPLQAKSLCTYGRLVLKFSNKCIVNSPRSEAESKEKHGVLDRMPELIVTSPYLLQSRLQHV